jgi:uncharacterized membrane protein
MTAPSGADRTRPLPVEILAVAVLVLMAGFVFKSHCYIDGAWNGGEQYTIGCYTDVVPFWSERGVADGAVPYIDTPLEYPVLTGAQIWLEGAASRALVGSSANALVFLTMVTLVNALLALGILALLHRMDVPLHRLWWWALAPAIVLYVGHNWDLLAMFLAVLCIALHRRGNAFGAGVALGLGTAAKLFPALLLPLLVLTHLRRRETGHLVRTIGGAALAWLTVNLPVALAVPERWAEFYTFSQERIGTFAATWTLLNDLGLLTTGVEQRNLWGLVAFALGAVAIVLAGWRTHRGHEWVLITPVLAWFLLTNKVWSPQFDLWLVPLLVLTARRVWPLAAFAVSDVLVYWTEFWWLARRAAYTPSGSYEMLAAASGLRALVLIGIIVFAVRDRAPEWIEPVRAAPSRPVVDEPTPAIGADSR